MNHHRGEFPLFGSFHRGLVKGLPPAFANDGVDYAPVRVKSYEYDHRAMTRVRVFGRDLVQRPGLNELG